MKTYQISRFMRPILSTFILTLLITSCAHVEQIIDQGDPSNPDEEPITTPEPTYEENNVNFDEGLLPQGFILADLPFQLYHCWMADCINSEYYFGENRTKRHLLSQSYSKVTRAMADSTIKYYFGDETLAWGPAIEVDAQGDHDYALMNLMYCSKSSKEDGVVTYSVALSGSNSVSPTDWLTEDINSANQHSWTPGGKVSAGAYYGFEVLEGLTDPSTGQKLTHYLAKEIAANKLNGIETEIVVTGHSLGGALAQVYSSHLKYSFKDSPTATVKAIVFAGPTAGNSAFATALSEQLDGYLGLVNSLDAIPHAWAAEELNELCTLYNTFDVCGLEITSNSLLNGVIKSMRNMSGNGDYTVPQPTIPFTNPTKVIPLSSSACGDLVDIYDYTIKAIDNDIYYYMNQITTKCTNVRVMHPQIKMFFHYMGEMAVQHTTAYSKAFLTSPSLINAIAQYGPTGVSKKMNADEGRIIINSFFKKINENLSKGDDCNCNK